jgi:hypothetical protein
LSFLKTEPFFRKALKKYQECFLAAAFFCPYTEHTEYREALYEKRNGAVLGAGVAHAGCLRARIKGSR